jgi:hypothetical protein
MDSLPIELICNIAYRLQVSKIADSPREPATGWTIHTAASRRDSRNFRLVCHRFRCASIPSLGEVLGDRKFRFTKVGIEDLQAISADASLRPYIQMLTFGGACYR